MIQFSALSARSAWAACGARGLVSPELDFESYATLPDQVSDHLGVVATLRVKKK